MKDIAWLLRNTSTQSIGYMGHNEISVSDLNLSAAAEIDRLRKEIECAAYAAEVGGLNALAARLKAALLESTGTIALGQRIKPGKPCGEEWL